MQSTDEHVKHGLCPKGKDSWCKYQKSLVDGTSYSHKKAVPQAVMQVIKPVFEDLSNAELLRKCMHGKTQNPNESVNNVIWGRLPKTVFVGLKTLHFGVYEAIASFNDGYIVKCETLKQLKMKVGFHTVQSMKRADKERIYFAEKQAQGATKQARQARRQRKRKLEDEEANPDDPAYGAGLF